MLTQARAVQLLKYEPETGHLIWREGKGRARAGDITGRSTGSHLQVGLDGKVYSAHGVIWLMLHGEYVLVDHRDGNGLNNRLGTLRKAMSQQNNRSRRVKKGHKLGLKGVSKLTRSNRYGARICVDGKRIELGSFATAEEAHAAYVAKAVQLFGAFANDGTKGISHS